MSLSPASQASPAAITAARLQLFAARCDYTSWAPKLEASRGIGQLTTPRRVRHWLAQLHVESGGFLRLEESLSYSAERLQVVWPSRFPTAASALPYAQSPRKLAERVYGGRLGNSAAGDGWRYRGRGLIMITGRDAYGLASHWTGLDLQGDPDQASEPRIAALIAAAWWADRRCNELADADDVQAITRRVNGGLTGLDDRRNRLGIAATIWRDGHG